MNNLFRAFVAALVLTGTVAAAHTANKADISTNKALHSLPRPQCDPGVPDGCGI